MNECSDAVMVAVRRPSRVCFEASSAGQTTSPAAVPHKPRQTPTSVFSTTSSSATTSAAAAVSSITPTVHGSQPSTFCSSASVTSAPSFSCETALASAIAATAAAAAAVAAVPSITPTDAQPSSVQQYNNGLPSSGIVPIQAETRTGSVHHPYLVNPSLGHGPVPLDAAAAGSMFHPYLVNPSISSGSEPSNVITGGSVLHPYLVELIRTTVRDEVEEVEERLHRDVASMHVDMLVRIDQLQV